MTTTSTRRLPHPPLLDHDPIRSAMQRWAPADIRATPAQRACFLTYTQVGDPAADALVAMIARLPTGEGRRLVDAAIAGGLRSVPEPPAELAAFFSEAESVPYWVDFDLVDRGARVIARTGVIGHAVLSMAALMGGYLASRPIQPLLATGDLENHAPRRLADTLAWYTAATTPGGLQPGASGYQATVRVRLRHAQIRAAMTRRPDWDHDTWDHPLNQAQTAGTLMLFALVHQIGCRAAGLRFTRAEREAVLHLWRYTGHLLGVDTAILPATEHDWWRMAWLQADYEFRTHDPASARLGQALLKALAPMSLGRGQRGKHRAAATAVAALMAAAARLMLGDRNGDRLGLPDPQAARVGLLGLRALVRASETVRPLVPGLTRWCESFGARQQRAWAQPAPRQGCSGALRRCPSRNPTSPALRHLAAQAAAAPRTCADATSARRR